MQYMGGKTRFAKELIPIIQSYITDKTFGYIEPFVGGANVIDKIKCKNKIGYDTHWYLISLMNKIKESCDDIPNTITFEEYSKVRTSFRNNTNDYPDWYKGLIGFCGSFGARWFDGGYARSYKKDGTPRDVTGSAIKSLLKQADFIKDVKFECKNFNEVDTDNIVNCVIYCDPPYKNAKSYSTGEFSYEEYYEWVRDLSKNNIVLCSEYWMPDDFQCIWEKKTTTQIDSLREANSDKNERVEKLYTYKVK